MAEKKKVGDVVGWAVVDKAGNWGAARTREGARRDCRRYNKAFPNHAPHRIAKVVLAK